jgi:hypothetical protein
MSPAKLWRPGQKGLHEFVSSGRDIHLGARGATELESNTKVDAEGLVSLTDGFDVYFYNGARIGKIEYRAGNLPPDKRPSLKLPDGRVVTPIREDEMPDRGPRKEW